MKDKYLKHIFNIRHQYITLKQLKDNVSDADAVVHVDFSENYNCKLHAEVQSMHFGGSRNQISLHTVVAYTKDKTKSFCTVSESTHHGPGAIWAHLQPVMKYLKNIKNIDTVHFVSDGPTTQYRSKSNFYMFHQEILQEYEFERATWNFTESGHGKSAADGIGGTVKRTADRLVANGIDITDAKQFCEHTGEQLNNGKMVLIEDSDIESKDNMPSDLQTVKGTMKLHQVSIRREKKGVLHLKNLSCFCKWPQECSCFKSGTPEHHLPNIPIREPLSDITNTVLTPQSCSPVLADTYPSAECDERRCTNGNVPEPLSDITNTVLTPQSCSPVLTDTYPSAECEKRSRKPDILPHPELVGTWCVIKYDGQPYPGIIQDLDDDSAEVKCMCLIGNNRVFWPLVEDIIWYRWENIFMTINEPTHVTSRHVQIDRDIWEDICEII